MKSRTVRPEHERRAAVRQPVNLWVQRTGSEGCSFNRAANLSCLGLRLEHTLPLPAGTSIHLRFVLPDERHPLDIDGCTVASGDPDDLGTGVRFVGLRPQMRTEIEGYLRRVSRRRQAEPKWRRSVTAPLTPRGSIGTQTVDPLARWFALGLSCACSLACGTDREQGGAGNPFTVNDSAGGR